jgi:hypothetical protein
MLFLMAAVKREAKPLLELNNNNKMKIFVLQQFCFKKAYSYLIFMTTVSMFYILILTSTLLNQ